MKLVTGFALLAMMTSQSFALSLNDLVGKYEVSSNLIPTTNIITLDSKGGITLVEKSVHGKLNCKGTSKLASNKIASKLTCENGLSFEQEINMSNVTNFNAFTAPVYSTLFGQEIPMNFKKIK
ncbi:MAG: hypothetical protein PHY93_11060 [Bacteriovorax sp.]|nr:hypothetical protein [Bacteriovorax sp.]